MKSTHILRIYYSFINRTLYFYTFIGLRENRLLIKPNNYTRSQQMPTSLTQVFINVDLFFNGFLQTSSEGLCSTGRRFKNHRVRIVTILANGAKYPILLGDQHTNKLGWTNFDDLTGVTTVNVISEYVD